MPRDGHGRRRRVARRRGQSEERNFDRGLRWLIAAILTDAGR
ncbi:hypothetical protein [Pseudonocardia zijingensis]